MRGIHLTLVVFAVLLISGCAGSRINPAIPSVSDDCTSSLSQVHPIRILWGTYNALIDPIALTVDFVPFRTADFTLNLMTFLQPPTVPSQQIFATIGPGSDPATGMFVIDISIRHPYPNLKALNCFDVRGIIMGDGSTAGIHDPTAIYGNSDETQILNADGYTRWWNFPEFTSYGTIFGYNPSTLLPPMQPTSKINPYKYFADGLGLSDSIADLDTSGRGNFSTSPGINTRRYEIQFNMETGLPVLDFAFVVDASWALPDKAYAPDYPVEAFPLEANCNEPFRISCTDAGSTAWWKSSKEFGGEIIMDIAISDWQGPENQYGAIGEFNQIWIEGPALNHQGGAVEVYYDSEVISSKQLTAVFRVTLDQLDLTHNGTEKLLITVVSKNPSTYEPQIDGGGGAFEFPDAPLSAYAFAEIEILDTGSLSNWATLQGNRANTGYTGLYGPSAIHEAPTWTYQWQYAPMGMAQPVFLTPTAAFTCNAPDGQPLPAVGIDLIDPDTLWTLEPNFEWQNWMNVKCISDDGQITLVWERNLNRIYGIDTSNGDKKWNFEGEILVDSYPTIDLDGNFIIPIEDIGYQSVDPHSGTINWTSEISVGYYDSPAVGDNGRIYCTSGSMTSCSLYALDPSDGSTIWKSQSLGYLRTNGVTVHPNGTIIIHSEDGLWCFGDNDYEEEILWVQPYPCPFSASCGVGPDGSIYILDYDGVLRRLDPLTGETIDSSGPWGDGNGFRPAIGADGLIYARTRFPVEDEAWINCWNPDCSLRWNYLAGILSEGAGMMSAPAIGPDGTLYSSYHAFGLCAWKD